MNWLRTFEAAARHQSFTTASRELGLTQTAVSQHIKALEGKLGQALFVRRPKSLRLTEIGKAYLPSVREALEQLRLSTDGLFGPDMTSTIVVRASMAFIVWLSPKLAAFQAQHPGVGIKLVTSIWPEAHDSQAVDLDIVVAPHDRVDGRLEKLSDEYIVPVCGQETAQTIGSIGDLLRCNPIHILGFDDHLSRYLANFGIAHDVGSVRLIVDTSVAACELVAAERGWAIVIERFAAEAIRSGRPLKIVGARMPLGQSHYLALTDSTQGTQAAAQAFRDWLRQEFVSSARPS